MWAKLLLVFGAACTCFAQSQTNGASDWGTLDAPTYPLYLNDNREGIAPSGPPWGLRSASNTNPYEGSYSSGITRRYTFDISRGTFSPDGYEMKALLVNGQFPGPLIEANWGDMIEVTVNNHITEPIEGTSIHWHGFLQKGSPWYDGVPAVTQCPIVSGGSFTYTFKADLYGTSWYHSHFSAQYAGGLFGPIIVHGPNIVDYDIDLGPIMLSDHYHQDYFSVLENVAGTNSSEWLQKSDSNLINGRMDYDCSLVTDDTPCVNNATVSKFRFHSHKKHRLRLINTSAEALQRFSIDGHKFTVMANDFVPVWPYEVDYVTLGVGQRMDVIVDGVGPPNESYWMRSNISEECSLTLQPHARAAVYYEDADTDALPTSRTDDHPDDGTCTTDPLSKTFPVYRINPPVWPDITQTLDIGITINDTGHQVWTVNNSSARLNYNYPPYLLANKGNLSSYDPDWNVYHFFNNGSIRLVLNNAAAAHPVHIHGHNMYVLHEGPGHWDGFSIERYANPQRRDTQMLRSGGHIVIQYDANNPGAWALHCHIAWHVSMGFYMTVMERPHEIDMAQPPPNVWENCQRWDEYTEDHIVHQIDSGVRA